MTGFFGIIFLILYFGKYQEVERMKKRILAMISIVLLAAMYISALVFSMIKSDFANTMLKISLLCTFFIPVVAYVIMMFYRLTHKNDEEENDNE